MNDVVTQIILHVVSRPRPTILNLTHVDPLQTLCGSLLELKISIEVTPALWNIRGKFDFSAPFRCRLRY